VFAAFAARIDVNLSPIFAVAGTIWREYPNLAPESSKVRAIIGK
jgi:hypothetical protein